MGQLLSLPARRARDDIGKPILGGDDRQLVQAPRWGLSATGRERTLPRHRQVMNTLDFFARSARSAGSSFTPSAPTS